MNKNNKNINSNENHGNHCQHVQICGQAYYDDRKYFLFSGLLACFLFLMVFVLLYTGFHYLIHSYL